MKNKNDQASSLRKFMREGESQKSTYVFLSASPRSGKTFIMGKIAATLAEKGLPIEVIFSEDEWFASSIASSNASEDRSFKGQTAQSNLSGTTKKNFDGLKFIERRAGCEMTSEDSINPQHHPILVLTPESKSVQRTAKLLRYLVHSQGMNRFGVVVNLARTGRHGQEAYRKLIELTGRYVDAQFAYLGHLPRGMTKPRNLVNFILDRPFEACLKLLVKRLGMWRSSLGDNLSDSSGTRFPNSIQPNTIREGAV